jgi:NADH:ubiquinone oxidoreductase subunit H
MLWTLVRRWAIVAVAVPLAAAGARRLSQTMESRRGPSRTSGLLRQSADFLQRTSGKSRSRRRWR